jgi:serine/threonine-protein kinase
MPETLGHYRLLDILGMGRMGELYRARDTRAGRTVALRVVDDRIAGDAERRARLLDRARSAASVSHPNIAALYEIGEDQGYLFLVFEHVPGDTLKAIVAERGLNPRRAVDLTIQLADAVAEAHAAGVVHGDIRPENIVITPRGVAKLLDLGVDERGEPGTDARRDVQALGAVLFEMLTGKRPAAQSAPNGAPTTRVPGSKMVNRAVSPELDAVVLKMIDGAGGGDQSAAAAAAELRSVAAVLDQRRAETPPPAISIPARRGRRTAPWIAIAVAGAVIAGALFLSSSGAGDRWLSSLTDAWRRAVGRASSL